MEIKQIKQQSDKQDISQIKFENQEFFNESYINDLVKILKTNSTAPTYIPRKFLDCLYAFYDGTDYKLYIYINNEWKSVTLS